MSTGSRRGTGSGRSRSSADGREQREQPGRSSRSGTMVRSRKRTMSMYEDNTPTALPLLLDMVRGPERLPADEELQEMLRGKLRVLQADSGEVTALFTELSTHLLSISPEDKIIYVTFKTFEEIWKFNTYYTVGFLDHCLESLLFDPKLWLQSVEEEVSAEISFAQDTLDLISKPSSCRRARDIAQFEPPFLGSGWSVRCLADGARGTAPKPSLEPVPAFHQWFLKSCPESILVGDGKPSCSFPLQFARGSCLAAEEYDADGPDELSLAPNDRIIIVGLLVSCFDWFVGKKESSGEMGLVKTELVKPDDTYNSEEVFIEGEDRTFFTIQEDKAIEETLELLKKKKQILGHSYKLDKMPSQDQRKKIDFVKPDNLELQQEREELKMHIQRFLSSEPTVPLNSKNHDSISPSETPNSSLRFFVPHIVEGKNHTEEFMPLFTFLQNQNYVPDYGELYRLTPEQLCSTTFTGHSDEDQLASFLSVARETARKKRLFWSQTRICFLLGKLCVGRSKFSQARVYFEEALSVPREGFADFRLLTYIYYNLSKIYLLQKNTESFFAVTERLVALLMGFSFCLEIVEEDFVLKHILKKAVLANNKQAEARASFLLAKHYWERKEKLEAIPYIERLLVLSCEEAPTFSISPSCGYLTLAGLYNELDLANLSACSFRKTSLDPSTTLTESLSCIVQLLSNSMPQQEPNSFPCHLAPYLHKVASLPELQEKQNVRHHVLSHHLTVCLSEMFSKHGMLDRAVQCMHELVESSPSAQSLPVSQVNSALIWLAWLHIEKSQPDVALDVLELVLATMPEHCTSPQEGEVLNLCGVALCSMGDLRRAVENYEAAIEICQEYEDLPNWAVAQANLGLLCLKAGASALAQTHLMEALQLFSELDAEGHEQSFITVLLELGKLYVRRGQMHYGKECYEWALLLSISAKLLDCELGATSQLCRLYSSESPDQTQCIVYSLHQLQLLQRTGDMVQTAEALETLSQLYLSLSTHKAYQAALDYTKSSLGMFIDMGVKEKEAYGWLQAGKIYHLLGQTELVELYIQAAQEVALSTGDTQSILSLLEAAGDIFFNSEQDRDKAITFYRDRALPISTKANSVHTRLRLCNKLTELMLNLKMFGEAVEFAQTALDISIALGERLNERVAYHRLAALYHRLQQFELAEHFYLKTLALCPSPLQFDEETLYYVRVYQMLGDIIFYDVKDPVDAAGYYHLALAAALDLGNKKSQLQLCTRLATIYHNFLMDRESSLFFYQRARGLAAELNIRRVNISPEQAHSSNYSTKTQ
ncbi:hypothetical protein WMY93_014980 [Mugilogobius chulae]|uniref:SH3 domain-containing protein n=1 Tax=Mugilogobius chulae TaxID=88201 RepID=A0AAW0P0H0_9GOBI